MNLAVTDNLSTRLAHALALIDEAIVDASSKLGTGPDNPAITRYSDVPGLNAFSIKLSDIMKGGRSTSSVLDPFAHDWRAQYRYARELVEKRKFSALRDLLTGHAYRDLSHGLRMFAPEVIEHIKAITGDLRAAAELTDAHRMAARGPDSLGLGSHRSDAAGNAIASAEPRQLARPKRRPA